MASRNEISKRHRIKYTEMGLMNYHEAHARGSWSATPCDVLKTMPYNSTAFERSFRSLAEKCAVLVHNWWWRTRPDKFNKRQTACGTKMITVFLELVETSQLYIPGARSWNMLQNSENSTWNWNMHIIIYIISSIPNARWFGGQTGMSLIGRPALGRHQQNHSKIMFIPPWRTDVGWQIATILGERCSPLIWI